jgi:hypothetical protein
MIKTLNDSIGCIAFALLLHFTLVFAVMCLCGCWSLFDASATGLQAFALLFIGGLFALLGSVGLSKIWLSLLNNN